MTYLTLKTLHILSMVLLFGTGLGSAFYKWMADRSGNVEHIAKTNKHVVLADWVFTTPTIIFQPLSGLWMASIAGLSLTSPWIALSLLLYVIAGLCWLPVVWLQLRMKALSSEAVDNNRPLPDLYWKMARWWWCLGVPAFIAMVLVVILMVVKHIPGSPL